MEKSFELKSFKFDVFGADCKYRVSATDDDNVVTEQDFHVKVSRPVHSALETLFTKDLRDIMVQVLDNTDYSAELELADSRIEVWGISFAGKNENIGISISGAIRAKCGKIAFKTPRIKYLAGDSEIHAKLTVFADAVVEEVKQYLFEGKTEEMGLFGEE